MTPPFTNTQEMVDFMHRMAETARVDARLAAEHDSPDIQAQAELTATSIAAIADRLEAQQWQPIATAPKDGRYVVITNGKDLCDIGSWRNEEKAVVVSGVVHRMARPEGWFNVGRCRVLEPTLWMPLPPTEAK